jgi:hypothetical protein
MKSNIVALERMISRCDDATLTTGERLLCGVSLLWRLLAEYDKLRKRAETLQKLSAAYSHNLSGTVPSEHCDTRHSTRRSGGWGRGRSSWRDSPDQRKITELTSIPHCPTPEEIRRYRDDREVLQSDSAVLQQYFVAFEKTREKLLSLQTQNAAQLALAEHLYASLHCDEWEGAKALYDVIGSINGKLMEVARRFPEASVPMSAVFGRMGVSRSTIDRKSRKGKRLSTKESQKSVSRLYPAIVDRQELREKLRSEMEWRVRRFLHCQYHRDHFLFTSQNLEAKRRELETLKSVPETDTDIIQKFETEILQCGERMAERYVEFNGKQHSRHVREFVADWRLIGQNTDSRNYNGIGTPHPQELSAQYRVPVSAVLTCQRYLNSTPELRESLPALKRLRTVSSPQPSVVTQLVISRPVETGNVWEVVIDETLHSLPILSVSVLAFEYGNAPPATELIIQRTGNPVVDETLSEIDSWHCGESVPDYTPTIQDINNCIDSFTRRLQTAIQNREWNRQRKLNAENAKKLQRQKIAKSAAALWRIDTVKLQDSYQAGNCLIGTSQFCQQWGISHRQEISGKELCRLWRARNWEYNPAFIRVIEHIATATAGGAK